MNAANILSAILPTRLTGAGKDANVPIVPGLPEDLVSGEGDPDFAEFVDEAFETILPEEIDTSELNTDITPDDVIMPSKAPALITAPILELSTQSEQTKTFKTAPPREVEQALPDVAAQVISQTPSERTAPTQAPAERPILMENVVVTATPPISKVNFIQAEPAMREPIVNVVVKKANTVLVPDTEIETANRKSKEVPRVRATTRIDKFDVPADAQAPSSFVKKVPASIPATKIVAPAPNLSDSSIDTDKLVTTDSKLLFQEMPSLSRASHITPGLASSLTASTAPVPIPKRVLGQVSSAIAKISDGRVEIRLDPPELGRVIVVITQNEAGITAHLAAESSDIVDFLKRNAETFSRELARAGFEGASLEFSKHDRKQENSDLEPTDEYAVIEGDSSSVQGELPSIKIQQDGLDIRL